MCRETKGFAFVEFLDERDAKDAKEEMDRTMVDGRELTVVFAQVRCCCFRTFVLGSVWIVVFVLLQERRKTPEEMRRSER